MIFTSPKRLRTTAWTINKNKKSQKAEGGKGRNFSASAFSNEGALICSGERTYGTEETGKNDKKTEAAPASPQNVSDGSSGGADLRRHLQRHPPCGKTASDITAVDYSGSDYEDNDITDWTGAPPIDVELLTPNSWSRPQTRLKKVDGIVIHYTANPGSTAMQNRDYFENLPETQEAQASSHFVVGIEGEVVQCIPTSEWSYASNQRNFDTISIECCHPDDSGEFTDETYNSVVQLAGFLCKRFNLTSDDVIRHYDVTEKLCPLYYVEHEDAWIQMKADIQAYADSLS